MERAFSRWLSADSKERRAQFIELSLLRYTFKTVKRIVCLPLLVLVANFALAAETSFRGVKVPDAKGKQTKAVLTFSDEHSAVEIYPAKAPAVSIPYNKIDKCSYEFTKKHRISEGTVLTAPIGAGAVLMLTKSMSHWLEIDYHDQDLPRVFVLRMDKHNYLRILDALKAHTGIDAEILGNADKRR